MTDKEIIKALECCVKAPYCSKKTDCPYKGIDDCVKKHTLDALDLINRQQAEIENYIKVAEYQQNLTLKKSFEIKELKAEIERLTARNFELAEKGEKVVIAFKNAKAEAIKEFAEKLKAKFSDIEYVIKTHRKTLPVARVKAEMDAVLQNGCANVIDKVVKEMVGEQNA